MLESGQVKVLLDGTHLKGEFALVRLKDEKNWLLIKHRDQYATKGPYNSEDDTAENSPINKFLRKQESAETVSEKKSSKVKSGTAAPAKKKTTALKNAAGVKNKPTVLKNTAPGKKKSAIPKTASPATKKKSTKSAAAASNVKKK